MKKFIAPLIMSAVLLSGCGAPEKDASYGTVNELAEAYEKSVDGVECGRTDISIHENGWAYVNCDGNEFAEVFADSETRTDVIAKNPLKPGQQRLIGSNWMIIAQQSKVKAAQEVLGGDIGR